MKTLNELDVPTRVRRQLTKLCERRAELQDEKDGLTDDLRDVTGDLLSLMQRHRIPRFASDAGSFAVTTAGGGSHIDADKLRETLLARGVSPKTVANLIRKCSVPHRSSRTVMYRRRQGGEQR